MWKLFTTSDGYQPYIENCTHKKGRGHRAAQVEGQDCRTRGFRWQQLHVLNIRQWKLLQNVGDAYQWTTIYNLSRNLVHCAWPTLKVTDQRGTFASPASTTLMRNKTLPRQRHLCADHGRCLQFPKPRGTSHVSVHSTSVNHKLVVVDCINRVILMETDLLGSPLVDIAILPHSVAWRGGHCLRKMAEWC